jgi:hypothetical protein
MNDPVNPPHYKQSSIEVIDFMREISSTPDFVAYCRLNSLKYLARAGKKEEQPPAQDFAKAAWYAQMAAHAINPEKYKDPRKT